jgi:hypothetical protein
MSQPKGNQIEVLKTLASQGFQPRNKFDPRILVSLEKMGLVTFTEFHLYESGAVRLSPEGQKYVEDNALIEKSKKTTYIMEFYNPKISDLQEVKFIAESRPGAMKFMKSYMKMFNINSCRLKENVEVVMFDTITVTIGD